MSDRGQQTPHSTDPAPGQDRGQDEPSPATEPSPAGSESPSGTGDSRSGSSEPSPSVSEPSPATSLDGPAEPQVDAGPGQPHFGAGAGQPAEVPFEITADDGDTAFRISDAPSDEPAEPAPNRKARTVVLGSLLAVALAGLGTVGWFGYQVNSQRHTNLATPATIGPLTLDDSEQATATSDYLQTALSAEISMDKSVGGVYTSPDERTVLFFGGTTLLWSPGSDLDSAFDLVSDDESGVSGLKEVDAGDFGGTMKCGVAKSADGDLTVCGWADHGSLALAMFADRTEAEAAPLMRELRSAIQTRS
ncbi:hypothetical protein [Actinoplanes sp. G11-F43]|uniref:hypothetical protein n=1 Tax=Actinoplanes sp. G11-F43 TaxID=3424130 RepID=UPI003D32BD29